MSDQPFYVISEAEMKDFSSHDTSRARFHHQDLAAFSEAVNNAAKRAFPNRGSSRYETVHACLMRWEDDELGVQDEFNALDHVLQDYGFQTTVVLIPSLNSHWDLLQKNLDFVRAFDSDRNLFVLYYAGHGRMNKARQAEWIFGQGPDSPYVDWSAIQGLFGKAKSDVLILLDTCAAASSVTTSGFAVMETIAACGFETRAPPPGEHSFTKTLLDVFRKWINKPLFSAASLHTEILFRLKQKEQKEGREGIPLEWCVTPIHWINTKDFKASGIEICRRNVLPLPLSSSLPAAEAASQETSSTFIDPMDIDFDDMSSGSTPLSSISSAGNYKVPHVLIALQLEEKQPLNARECAQWLEKIPLMVKWAKIEAVYPSYSTLMILSMPMPIWDMLPDHPACSFVGYVTAPKIGGLIMSEEERVIKGPIVISAQNETSDLSSLISNIFDAIGSANEISKYTKRWAQSIRNTRKRKVQERQSVWQLDHTSTVNSEHKLDYSGANWRLNEDEGEAYEAHELDERNLERHKNKLVSLHEMTLNLMKDLGSLYESQGNFSKAEVIYKRSFLESKKALGTVHASTLEAADILGSFYKSRGKLAEAEQLSLWVLQGYDKTFGSEHIPPPYEVAVQGTLYTDQGRLAEGERMFQRALKGHEKLRDLEDRYMLSIVCKLGNIYTSQGKLVEAKQMYQRALQGHMKARGIGNTASYVPALNTLWAFGSLFERQANIVKARIMYRKAFLGYRRVFGPDYASSKILQDKLSALDAPVDDKAQ